MRTGAARGQAGHFHEAGFYGSDAEFRALIVPFAEAGIAAGEPVIVGCDDRKSGLLRSWLTDPSAVEFLGAKSLYATPAGAIATCRRLFEFHVAMGAGQIRMAGEVPHPGNGGRFEGWDRYESAINTVWEEFPVWGRCLYDTTTTAAVLDVVERTHPRIVWPSGQRRASDRYQDARAFDGLPYAPDPLEASPPLVELVNRSAADAWHALAPIGRGRIPAAAVHDLLLGVTEAVTNAQRHGRPPATVRIWAAPDRIVVTVHDTGHGPADRLAGLVPAPGSVPDRLGYGLWVIHQLDLDVALRHTDDGFTVRLRGGTITGLATPHRRTGPHNWKISQNPLRANRGGHPLRFGRGTPMSGPPARGVFTLRDRNRLRWRGLGMSAVTAALRTLVLLAVLGVWAACWVFHSDARAERVSRVLLAWRGNADCLTRDGAVSPPSPAARPRRRPRLTVHPPAAAN